MSQNLFWTPVRTDKHMLPKSLKYLLERQLQGFPTTLNVENLVFLRGVSAGLFAVNCTTDLINGVTDLIHAIERHGSVELTVED